MQTARIVKFVLSFLWSLSFTALSAANLIPLGNSSGVAGRNAFFIPVFDSFSNKLIQVWLDTNGVNLYYASYDGITWSAPTTGTGNLIPLGNSSGVAGRNNAFFRPVFDPFSNQLIQVWLDTNGANLYYASYDGTTWSAPTTGTGNLIPLGNSSGVAGRNAFFRSVFDPFSNQLIQVWLDTNGTNLYYASYDGTTWSAPTTGTGNLIPLGNSSGVAGRSAFFHPVFDTFSNQLILVWLDSNGVNLYYASYDGTTWSAPTAGAGNLIPLGNSSGVAGRNAFFIPVFDTFSNQLIQVWLDTNGVNLYYASYDGTAWSAPTTGTGNLIPLGNSLGVAGRNAFTRPVFDSFSNQLIQTWLDTNGTNLYYASYDGIAWSAPTTGTGNLIPLGNSVGVAGRSAFFHSAFDTFSNQLIQVWLDTNGVNLYYASYDGTTWSAPTAGTGNLIPLGNSSGVAGRKAFFQPVFDPFSNQLIQVWLDTNGVNFYYATYNGVTWSAP